MQPMLKEIGNLLVMQNAPQQGGAQQILVPFLIMMAILYFIVLRPQAKERKRHDDMLRALKRGDEIVTSSGILGTITDFDDSLVTVEVARNVKIRILKSSIAKKASELKEGAAESDKGKEKA